MSRFSLSYSFTHFLHFELNPVFEYLFLQKLSIDFVVLHLLQCNSVILVSLHCAANFCLYIRALAFRVALCECWFLVVHSLHQLVNPSLVDLFLPKSIIDFVVLHLLQCLY